MRTTDELNNQTNETAALLNLMMNAARVGNDDEVLAYLETVTLDNSLLSSFVSQLTRLVYDSRTTVQQRDCIDFILTTAEEQYGLRF